MVDRSSSKGDAVSDAEVSELLARLESAEESLQRCERLATANRYAGAVMHEVNNPLEALNNLIFLTRVAADDAEQVSRYMQEAELQLEHLGQITRRTLTFYKQQLEPTDFDLVEILDAALLLHSHRTRRQKIEVRRRVGNAAISRILVGEILQICQILF